MARLHVGAGASALGDRVEQRCECVAGDDEAKLGPQRRQLLAQVDALYLAARARLRLAQARPDDALEAGRRLKALHAPSPAVAPWRSDAALAHLALGDRTSARTLIDEEIRLSRRTGLPRASRRPDPQRQARDRPAHRRARHARAGA
jgi:hypothetical protein